MRVRLRLRKRHRHETDHQELKDVYPITGLVATLTRLARLPNTTRIGLTVSVRTNITHTLIKNIGHRLIALLDETATAVGDHLGQGVHRRTLNQDDKHRRGKNSRYRRPPRRGLEISRNGSR